MALQEFVAVTYDPGKRSLTSAERGLDFADAAEVFAGRTIDREDGRRDDGETRIMSADFLSGRMVMIGWTPRGPDRHVSSMRKADDREQRKLKPLF